MKTHQFEVVVVGAGGAGLMAGLYASRTPRRPSSASSIPPARTPARPRAASARRWATTKKTIPNGTPTIRSKAPTTWATRTPSSSCATRPSQAVYELEHMGLPFDRTPEGKIAQRPFGGHTNNVTGKPVRARLPCRRPHRAHDPADALPAVHQEQGQFLR